MIDVHRILVAELTGPLAPAAVSTRLAEWSAPAVMVTRFGGTDSDEADGHLDSARVQFDCYGVDEAACWTLAALLRGRLRVLPGAHADGVVSSVKQVSVRWVPDTSIVPPAPRVVLTCTIAGHA